MKLLNDKTYFAKPYHAWERGQNENANGLLRQYFPKDKPLVDITRQSVFDAVDGFIEVPLRGIPL